MLHYLLGGDVAKAERCLALLKKADKNEVELHISELVVAELVWVLQSPRYNFTPERIRDLILPVVLLPGVRLASKGMYSDIFELYVEKHIDYIDAYNAVVMRKQGLNDIYSYDKHFDGMPGIQRREP